MTDLKPGDQVFMISRSSSRQVTVERIDWDSRLIYAAGRMFNFDGTELTRFPWGGARLEKEARNERD